MDASLNGILVIDKPVGMTSMRAVERVRRSLGGAKAGHAGTLDPLASGVLLVAVGRATKDIPRLMGMEKRYETQVDLSATTATLDAEGERIPGPQPAPPPTREMIEAALPRFRGTFDQAPPAYSAVKIQGRRAYDLARSGQDVAPQPRPVTVHELEIVAWAWPVLTLRIRCAKGFYVRSLARDLAEALGLAGHCLAIRRTAVGPYAVDDAMPLPLNEPCPPVDQRILPLQPPDAVA